MKFRTTLILCLVVLLCTQEVESWRRVRRFFRRVGRAVRRVSNFATRVTKGAGKVVKTAAKIKLATLAAKAALAAVGKRSVDEISPKAEFCMFVTYDWNANGLIEETEIEQIIKETKMEELEEFFANMDANKDNQVTIEEFDKSGCKALYLKDIPHGNGGHKG